MARHISSILTHHQRSEPRRAWTEKSFLGNGWYVFSAFSRLSRQVLVSNAYLGQQKVSYAKPKDDVAKLERILELEERTSNPRAPRTKASAASEMSSIPLEPMRPKDHVIVVPKTPERDDAGNRGYSPDLITGFDDTPSPTTGEDAAYVPAHKAPPSWELGNRFMAESVSSAVDNMARPDASMSGEDDDHVEDQEYRSHSDASTVVDMEVLNTAQIRGPVHIVFRGFQQAPALGAAAASPLHLSSTMAADHAVAEHRVSKSKRKRSQERTVPQDIQNERASRSDGENRRTRTKRAKTHGSEFAGRQMV